MTWRLAMKALCLFLLVMFANDCYAQKVVIFVGSAEPHYVFALAGALSDPNPNNPVQGPCTAPSAAAETYHIWTDVKATSPIFAVAVDSNRSAAFQDEPGAFFWVEWDNSTAPTIICAYLSMDTMTSNRMLFGTYADDGHATLRFDMPVGTPADPAIPSGGGCLGGTSQAGAGDLQPYLTDDPGLPCPVYTALVGQQFTAVISDIRPEDSEFQTQRAVGSCAGGNCFTGGSKESGLGYGGTTAGLPGTSVQSAFSNSKSRVTGYYISGNDPATGQPVLGGGGYVTTEIGADPVAVIVGLTRSPGPNGCPQDFANTTPANVPSHTLAFLYGGNFAPNIHNFSFLSRTTDLNDLTPTQSAAYGGAGLNGCPVTILQREVLSATGSLLEWQVLEAEGVGLSQEDYIDPTGNTAQVPINCFAPPAANPVLCSNPTWLTYSDGSVRARVVGLTEMVDAVDGDTPESCATSPCPKAPNAIGYEYWTFENLRTASAQSNARYLMVDNVDPVQAYYFNPQPASAANPTPVVGQSPLCNSLPCRMPMSGLRDGGYRIWSMIRMIQPTNPALDTAAGAPTAAEETIASMIAAAAQEQADPGFGNLTDFIPAQDKTGHIFNVFRSHYDIPNIVEFGTGSCSGCGSITSGALLNGTNQFPFGPYPAYADNGGDMAGAIFYDQNDMDVLNDFGAVITAWRQ